MKPIDHSIWITLSAFLSLLPLDLDFVSPHLELCTILFSVSYLPWFVSSFVLFFLAFALSYHDDCFLSIRHRIVINFDCVLTSSRVTWSESFLCLIESLFRKSNHLLRCFFPQSLPVVYSLMIDRRYYTSSWGACQNKRSTCGVCRSRSITLLLLCIHLGRSSRSGRKVSASGCCSRWHRSPWELLRRRSKN